MCTGNYTKTSGRCTTYGHIEVSNMHEFSGVLTFLKKNCRLYNFHAANKNSFTACCGPCMHRNVSYHRVFFVRKTNSLAIEIYWNSKSCKWRQTLFRESVKSMNRCVFTSYKKHKSESAIEFFVVSCWWKRFKNIGKWLKTKTRGVFL